LNPGFDTQNLVVAPVDFHNVPEATAPAHYHDLVQRLRAVPGIKSVSWTRVFPLLEGGQLVQLWEAPSPGKRNSVSPDAFLDWKKQSTAFAGFSLLLNTDLNLTSEAEAERISGVKMSANGLQILRARPLLGRAFAPDEDQPGKDRVIVLTHRLWQRRFGGETNIVGRTIQLSEQSYTVIGVLPPRFLPRAKAEFVIPGAIAPKDANQRAAHWLDVFGRLKSGVTVEQARSEVNAVAARLRALYPAQKKDWSVAVVPMQEGLTRDFKSALLMLLGAVGFVLLIACTNVANLLLARASARQQETAIRAALGASRWQIIRHPSQKDWGASVQPLNEQIVGGWGARSAGRRNLQDERDGILGPHVRSDRFGRNGLANDCAACATERHARGFAGARDDRHAVRVGREANAGLAHRIRIESNAFS